MLKAISPIDGRYEDKTRELSDYFSEYALIRYRIFVEIQYFIALTQHNLPQLIAFDESQVETLNNIFEHFDISDAERVKMIEKTTNHDVKAIEYYLKERFDGLEIGPMKEFIHFGLTSQDINNTAVPLMIKQALHQVYLPQVISLQKNLKYLTEHWSAVPMLARTHGQPASPTLLGKEIMVFSERLENQINMLKSIPITAKFGGATGNFNAHYAAYPKTDWVAFANHFVSEYLGLERQQFTTQIEHYDYLAALFHNMMRINTILIDLCRDIWSYISMDYFKQKTVENEVGSSAMPHKVNPIDFENAEGNLGLANALLDHLAAKLPVSRLQRDLTDSTVIRNIGVPFGHTIIAIKSIQKGMDKLLLNEYKLNEDLENNWAVVAEGIQTILRREGFDQPYEALKKATRGKSQITKHDMLAFIESLPIEEDIKEELRQLSPSTYTGIPFRHHLDL